MPPSHAETDQHPKTSALGLTVPQILAGAAAAASSAYAASYLGVAGTIVGAALASVVATVATATYSHAAHRSTDLVRRTAGRLRGRPGARLVLGTLAVLGVALGGITVVEAVLGKPLATVVGHSDRTGPSVASIVGSGAQAQQHDDDVVTQQPEAPASTPASPAPAPAPVTPTSPENPEPTDPTPAPEPPAEPTPVQTTPEIDLPPSE